MQRLDGVDHADVNLVKRQGEVFPKPGKSFDPALIPKAIQNAGFTVVEVLATAAGTLLKKNQFLELEIPGLKHSFVLEGGTQIDSLKKRSDLIGKKVEVTGKLHPDHGGQPPGLTVESFLATP